MLAGFPNTTNYEMLKTIHELRLRIRQLLRMTSLVAKQSTNLRLLFAFVVFQARLNLNRNTTYSVPCAPDVGPGTV